MEDQQPQQDALVSAGRELVAWEIDEYPVYNRSRNWYIAMGIVGAFCIVYAIATANFLFAVIVLMLGIITLMTTFQKPARVPVSITSTGVVIGEQYYPYKQMKDFSIVYNPPQTKLLYVSFQAAFRPMLAIPLEETDPNIVREELLPFCVENLARTEERLTDTIRRMYKL